MIKALEVFLWDIKVGTLVEYKEKWDSKVCFYFDEGFAPHGYDIAPLRAPINGVLRKGTLPVYPEKDKIFMGLPSFIADSLPDSWGQSVFKAWAKSQGISTKKLSVLDNLAYMGIRAMGALEFVPPLTNELETPFKVEISNLYDFSQKILKEVKDLHIGMPENLEIQSLMKIGTSAGGRRSKAVINVNETRTDFYSGQVDSPEPGYEPMIIKFDEKGEVPTTRIEYSYYLMAKDAGLNMMHCELLESNGTVHFLTRRFDRENGEKVHVQTLAALDPLSDSYEALFNVACSLKVPEKEKEQIFRAMVLNVITGNVDDHNKNFGFMMRKDGVWHFAPTYDYTFAVDLSAMEFMNRHSMNINGKNDDIKREDIMEIARLYNIRGANSILEKLINVAKQYNGYARLAGLNNEWRNRISSEISRRIQGLDAMEQHVKLSGLKR